MLTRQVTTQNPLVNQTRPVGSDGQVTLKAATATPQLAPRRADLFWTPPGFSVCASTLAFSSVWPASMVPCNPREADAPSCTTPELIGLVG
jgi:hypothetical protein